MNTATMAPGQAPNDQRVADAPGLLVPFPRASRKHEEPFLDQTFALGANSSIVGPVDVPSYGYLRSIVLDVQFTGGAGTGATVKEDGPFAVFSEVSLSDVNGQPIFGPVSGFDLYLVNKYGGYAFNPNPKGSGAYSALSAAGNGRFFLRIPVEISGRDALGALGNMNAASAYKLRLTVAPKTEVFSVDPSTTVPSVRIRAHMEAWSQPNGTDLNGNAQQMTPPAHGTTQYWSKFVKGVNAGANTIQLPRVGSLIRNLIFVYRTTTPARSTTNFPDPFQVMFDARQVFSRGRDLQLHYMTEKYGFAATDLDTGVFALDFTSDFDGHPGGELRDEYLPTTQATRLELLGTFGADGTLTVLTNDVAPAGQIYAGV